MIWKVVIKHYLVFDFPMLNIEHDGAYQSGASCYGTNKKQKPLRMTLPIFLCDKNHPF